MTWLADIVRAWRASLRRPGFLLLASGVLALGVGASAAVFALIDSTLLHPLPFPQPSRIVVLGRISGQGMGPVSPHEYQFLKGLDGVQSIGLVRPGSVANIAGTGTPQQVSVTYVDRGLLPALGLRPLAGRNFDPAEDRPNGPRAVMLSEGFWRRAYGGDAGVVGRSLTVEGRPATIVGIVPRAFDAVSDAGGIVLPLALPALSFDYNHNGHMAVARLAPGARLAAVAAQVDARERTMYRDMAMGGNWKQPQFGAASLNATLHRGKHSMLVLFSASAALVLLIALVNLTNLMFVRSLSRGHDVAVRHALGAPLLRLMLPALAEGALIGLSGALLGMGLAFIGTAALRRFVPAEWFHGSQLDIGASAWMLALLLGVLGALLAAALGLWRSRRALAMDVLREGGRGAGVRDGRLGRLLVVTQVALAVTLLSLAGVLAHGLFQAAHTPLGFASDHVLTFELAPVKADYPDAASVEVLSQRLVQRLRAIPGVDDAAYMTNLPAGDGLYDQFNNGMKTPDGKAFEAQLHGVGDGFFELFSIALRQGRLFTRNDTRGSEPVAVVSQDLADRYEDGEALGKTLMVEVSDGPAVPVRIVGVVDNTYQFGPLQSRRPMLYLPLSQMPAKTMTIFLDLEPMRFALRGHGGMADWRAGIDQALAEVAPGQPIARLQPMPAIVRQTTADARLGMLLIGLFAALSLLLAAAGMYAVMAVAVAAREREFGVRTALGSTPARLVALVLRDGLLQIAAGLAVGVGMVVAATRLLADASAALADASFVRIGVFDPLAFACVCSVLAMAGWLACLVPALRAGRVDPMRALRGE